MRKQIDMKRECEAIIENNLMGSMLYYFQDFPEQREEFCEELTNAFTRILQNLKKEFESDEDL